MKTEAFYVEEVDAAKDICSTCAVCEPCLLTALARNEKYGVWGGTTAGERRRLLAKIRREARDSAKPHQEAQG